MLVSSFRCISAFAIFVLARRPLVHKRLDTQHYGLRTKPLEPTRNLLDLCFMSLLGRRHAGNCAESDNNSMSWDLKAPSNASSIAATPSLV